MAQHSKKFGPWALVTGANSGIGKAFSQQLASQGYNLVLVGRQPELIEKVSAEIGDKYSIETREVIVDLSTDNFLAQVITQTRGLDIGLLISNAGDDAMGALLRVNLNNLKQMLRLNTSTHLELMHHFGRQFETRGGGGILLVSSTAGLQGTPYLANYSGSKAYLLNLGLALNYELRKTGVSVTVLVPGPTKTPGLLNKPDIPLATLPAPQMSPELVVRIGLNALQQNKPYVIAGNMNRLMSGVGRLLGRTIGRNMWGQLIQGIVPQALKAR